MGLMVAMSTHADRKLEKRDYVKPRRNASGSGREGGAR
jgi:hypothetical protein